MEVCDPCCRRLRSWRSTCWMLSGRGGRVLRQRAADVLDEAADLLAHGVMGAIGLFLVADLLAPDLLFGLRRAEEVRGQLGAAHVVQDHLARLEAFAGRDIAGAQAAIEPAVAMILKDREVPRFHHAGAARAAASWRLWSVNWRRR